jgi:hypothetical protein
MDHFRRRRNVRSNLRSSLRRSRPELAGDSPGVLGLAGGAVDQHQVLAIFRTPSPLRPPSRLPQSFGFSVKARLMDGSTQGCCPVGVFTPVRPKAGPDQPSAKPMQSLAYSHVLQGSLLGMLVSDPETQKEFMILSPAAHGQVGVGKESPTSPSPF